MCIFLDNHHFFFFSFSGHAAFNLFKKEPELFDVVTFIINLSFLIQKVILN